MTTTAEVTKTVETVVTFRPHDAEHARAIARFLVQRCTARKDGTAIPGSWEVPDIRATPATWPALQSTGDFRLVVANLLQRPDGTEELVMGRQRSRFGLRWKAVPMVMNALLAEYIAGHGSGVRP